MNNGTIKAMENRMQHEISHIVKTKMNQGKVSKEALAASLGVTVATIQNKVSNRTFWTTKEIQGLQVMGILRITCAVNESA